MGGLVSRGEQGRVEGREGAYRLYRRVLVRVRLFSMPILNYLAWDVGERGLLRGGGRCVGVFALAVFVDFTCKMEVAAEKFGLRLKGLAWIM